MRAEGVEADASAFTPVFRQKIAISGGTNTGRRRRFGWLDRVSRSTRGLFATARNCSRTEPLHTCRTYVPREKGIDLRIAIDVMTLAFRKVYDVALVFSQDQDLSEVARELRDIASKQNRWIKMASAYPVGSGTDNARGINGADWIRIDQGIYDSCLDPQG